MTADSDPPTSSSLSDGGSAKPPRSMIARVAMILTVFQNNEDLIGVSQLSRRTGLPKASVSRITKELVAHDFLERKDDKVRLGLKFFELGAKARRPKNLRRLAIATLADLRRTTGHTIHLAVLEGREVVYIEKLHGREDIRLPSTIGGRYPAHATGVGKAMLAHYSERQVEDYLKNPLENVGPRTITRPAELRIELEAVRANGVAYEREESGRGICCAASPILGADGTPIAGISISGPIDTTDLARVAPAVQAATLGLNRQIRMNPHLHNHG